MERKPRQGDKVVEVERPHSGTIHFDFKNATLLLKHTNPHARMHSRRRTALAGREQRLLAQAIKRARFMALMPYVSR